MKNEKMKKQWFSFLFKVKFLLTEDLPGPLLMFMTANTNFRLLKCYMLMMMCTCNFSS